MLPVSPFASFSAYASMSPLGRRTTSSRIGWSTANWPAASSFRRSGEFHPMLTPTPSSPFW
ncbi:hypothetical protein [Halorussus caseinilyticus]|uniref:Uncharacterized protein n=1 Tax=Halorussus caseinilyticus TaxID=3034025 RepID=A0ABD5WRX3_9EURY